MQPPEVGSQWRHLRRGTTYTIQGFALLQCNYEWMDDTSLVLYKSDATELVYARPVNEFMDGRFIKENM